MFTGTISTIQTVIKKKQLGIAKVKIRSGKPRRKTKIKNQSTPFEASRET